MVKPSSEIRLPTPTVIGIPSNWKGKGKGTYKLYAASKDLFES